MIEAIVTRPFRDGAAFHTAYSPGQLLELDDERFSRLSARGLVKAKEAPKPAAEAKESAAADPEPIFREEAPKPAAKKPKKGA